MNYLYKTVIAISLTLSITSKATAENATKVLKCNIKAKDLNESLIGVKWLGHGVHYSLKPFSQPYTITYQGVEYKFEATFNTVNDILQRSVVSIEANNYTAQSDSKVTMKNPAISWEGISLSCNLFDDN